MKRSRDLEQLPEPIRLTQRLGGVVIGSLVGFGSDGAPLVDFPGNPTDNAVLTRTTALLIPDDVGRHVALLFENDDPGKPILIGPIIHPRRQNVRKLSEDRDNDRLEFTAKREIVIRCGNASITLTRAGKVLIRGDYVSSQSTGVNKVKGGAVHIN